MDNPKSIAPLMTKMAELRRVYSTKNDDNPRYVVCNQFTAQQLSKEAQTVGKLQGSNTKILIDNLTLVVHPQDPTQQLVMEVV